MIDPASAAEAALDWLAQRHSVGPKHLGPPAPERAELERAALLAARAPDHALLRPYRFLRVPDSERERLARLFEQDARRRGQDEAEVAKARARAFNGPALVALLARIEPDVDEAPEHEQWVCVGGALMNFLNALHLMGYAAKVLSGASVRDPGMREAFCGPGEQLVAWIVAGSATRSAHERVPAHGRSTPLFGDWA
jgi:nitroreductase